MASWLTDGNSLACNINQKRLGRSGARSPVLEGRQSFEELQLSDIGPTRSQEEEYKNEEDEKGVVKVLGDENGKEWWRGRKKMNESDVFDSNTCHAIATHPSIPFDVLRCALVA